MTKLLFMPNVGDHVEFLSDRQTEKGPSSGHVECLFEFQCAIKHSDAVEWFDIRSIKVTRFTDWSENLVTPGPSWALA